jgi:magnesium transporter
MSIKPVQIKLINRLLQTGSDAQIIHALEKIHPAELANLFTALPSNEIKRLIDCLVQIKKAGQALKEIPEFFIPDILELLEADQLAQIISRLDADDALYLLDKMDEAHVQAVLERLDERKRQTLERYRLYPKDSAGSVMSSNFLAVPIGCTVDEAIQILRAAPEREGVFYVYVVEGRRLVGVLPLRSLVLADSQRSVRELMTTGVVTVQASEDQEKAAQQVSHYNLLAIPVVNDQQELLGVITVDDVIDIFEEEATEDMYNMAGLSEVDRAFTPALVKIRNRLPWMLINLCTAFLAASVVGFFEVTIAKVAILAAYMPIVAGMGGNGGTQSLVVMTRSIALGEIEFAKARKAILSEVLNGLIVGGVCGLVTGVIAYAVNGKSFLGVILFLAMLTNMCAAGLAGAVIPLALKKLKLDPAVASGILVTTVTDITGFFTFLSLARLWIDKL